MDKKSKKILIFSLRFINQLLKSTFLVRNGACRFTPTCSHYAAEAIEKLPLYQAVPLIILRILKCNPLFRGGYDPIKIQTEKR
jgi:putative membrane protein insertion efficiency factor